MYRFDIRRLIVHDLKTARTLFTVMTEVPEETPHPLSDAYLRTLLARDDFWALAAWVDGQLAGGVTAHTLLMTRNESRELFIYDLAVVPAQQRKGIGRALVTARQAQDAAQGIDVLFDAADQEDTHALDFYRAVGGEPAPVTMFSFVAETE